MELLPPPAAPVSYEISVRNAYLPMTYGMIGDLH